MSLCTVVSVEHYSRGDVGDDGPSPCFCAARARAWSGAIFHGSSVFGTYLAIAAGAFIVNNPRLGWRGGFAIGALPALLTLWIRWRLREPETWVKDQSQIAGRQAAGRLLDLFAPGIVSRTLVGFSLAVIGLATFWGVHIYGKDFALRRSRHAYEQQAQLSDDASPAAHQAVWKDHQQQIKSDEMLGMFLATLELIKGRKIHAEQPDIFGAIWLKLAPPEANGAAPQLEAGISTESAN